MNFIEYSTWSIGSIVHYCVVCGCDCRVCVDKALWRCVLVVSSAVWLNAIVVLRFDLRVVRSSGVDTLLNRVGAPLILFHHLSALILLAVNWECVCAAGAAHINAHWRHVQPESSAPGLFFFFVYLFICFNAYVTCSFRQVKVVHEHRWSVPPCIFILFLFNVSFHVVFAKLIWKVLCHMWVADVTASDCVGFV